MEPAASPNPCVLVTGATGYIGGRLVPWLLRAGYRVRCAVRFPEKLASRPWAGDQRVEVLAVDLGDPIALARALDGCAAVYWLVHSMVLAGAGFHAEDVRLARSCATAASAAGVGRIIYLGGLGEAGPDLSPHLASRRAVEEALASGPVPVCTLRAAIILGSGSASFEILRYLVERLPVMITPRWVGTSCQPIAIRNVLHYLVESLRLPQAMTLDIGGPDVLTYRQLMAIMAEELGLRRRLILPVPVLTPRLSSWWIHLVTPVDRRIARPLAEGLRNRVVCRDDLAQRCMPQKLLSTREAIRLALLRQTDGLVETSWSDAGAMPGDPDWAGGTLLRDRRERLVGTSTQTLFAACCRIGGRHGWYGTDPLWRVRGGLDRLVGGPGLRRGRRDQEHLNVGDAVDFWRVTTLDPGRRLVLTAEMRLPGEARLEFLVEPTVDGARLVQTASFRPRGIAGILYWYAVLPLHALVFPRLADGICAEAKTSGQRPAR